MSNYDVQSALTAEKLLLRTYGVSLPPRQYSDQLQCSVDHVSLCILNEYHPAAMLTNGEDSWGHFLHIYALSAALHVPIKSYCLPADDQHESDSVDEKCLRPQSFQA